MVNNTDILNAWQRIGWQEPSKTGYTTILDTDNKTSLSGLYFDEYPISNFVNVKDTYYDVSVSNSVINAYLTNWQKSAILDICKDVFGDDTIEYKKLIYDEFDFNDVIENSGKFVFWKIIVPEGYAITLKNVGITLDSNASFNLYIFNSSQKVNVSTKAVTSVANSEKVTALNTTLYGSTQTVQSGIYYIGYFQNDIGSAKAIQREFSYFNSVCSFEPAIADPNSAFLPEKDNIQFTSYTHGINLEYAIYKDNTNKYLLNPSLFDKAIQYNVWIKVLEQFLLTSRLNTPERNIKEVLNESKIFAELNGFRNEEMMQIGMRKKYENEIKNIKKSFKRYSLTTATMQ